VDCLRFVTTDTFAPHHTDRNMGVPALRGLVLTLFWIFCLIFCCAALGSYIATAETSGDTHTEAKASLWYLCLREHTPQGTGVAQCTSTTDPKIGCGALKSHFRAIQAFYIMTTILVIIGIILAIVDHVNSDYLLRTPIPPKLVFVVLLILQFIFSLIGWATAIGAANRGFCDTGSFSDQPGFSYGASGFLMLIVWIATILMLGVACIMPPRAPNEPVREAARPNHPVVFSRDDFVPGHRNNTTNARAAPVVNEPPHHAFPSVDQPYNKDVNANHAPMG
jgi:hypothetical protein